MTASDNAQELAQQLLDVLKDKGQTLAVAESCTGGLLGGALTAVPGSSSVFLGWVSLKRSSPPTALSPTRWWRPWPGVS